MPYVITFEDFQPVPRYDETPWTEARIEEAATADGTYAEIDTITLDPVDADPSSPAARDFTTENATAANLWYRIVFVDGDGDESAPTAPIQNTDTPSIYATVNELARILKIRAPSAEQTVAMTRVLVTAAGEIDAEIDREDDDPISGWELSLAAQVNLERAVEHWRQQESPFGIIGLGGDLGATPTARDSWARHALKLAPLKRQWGFA